MTVSSALGTVGSNQPVIVLPVQSKAELRAFIKFPWHLYADEPYWVPPLIQSQLSLLDRKTNPFFQHSDAQLFLARRGQEVVGRVAAIHNRNHNAFHQENIGFFGFFECIRDYDVARALYDAAWDWVKQRGLTALRGPTSFSTNDECGFLLEGFDSSPYIMMTYSQSYYLEFAEQYGLRKVKDLYAWRLDKQAFQFPDKFRRRVEELKQKAGITIRSLNMKDFPQEIARIKAVYNKAWERNWGFVPMTDAEFNHMAKEFKAIVVPELLLIAEAQGQPAGFALALPDINRALKKINGKLFPFGLFKLMYHARQIKALRVITLGVIPEFRRAGIAPVFYMEIADRGIKLGYEEAEMSWMLEDNEAINQPMVMMGGKLYKKYRLYEMAL